MKKSRSIIRRFLGKSEGAIAVEFAIVMPVMLICFAAIVESGRMFWAYQQVVSGVRDASRFFARAAPLDICDPSSFNNAQWSGTLAGIIENSYNSGGFILGGGVSLNNITPVLLQTDCKEDDGIGGTNDADFYNADTVVVATVTANLEMDLPFYPLLNILSGGGLAENISMPVTDSVRIFGQ